MADHECREQGRRPEDCICDSHRGEPDERCPVHGAGEWPPRCEECGRLLPWPDDATTANKGKRPPF